MEASAQIKILFLFFFSSAIVDQILTHFYTEMLLDMRLAFREARHCITSGNKVVRCFDMLYQLVKLEKL